MFIGNHFSKPPSCKKDRTTLSVVDLTDIAVQDKPIAAAVCHKLTQTNREPEGRLS
jgi:hypothetical protein